MSWQDRLLPASFGGVPFKIASHEFQGGRRDVVHELPQRERPLTQDLGRAPREWRVEAYVIGDDYFAERDALVEVCEGFPPGYPYRPGRVLVHPYLGQLRAHCRSIQLRESSAEGRMARFSIVFVEVSEELEAPRDLSRLDELRASADAAEDAAESALASVMRVLEQPEEVLAAASAEARALARKIQGLDVFNGLQGEVSALGGNLRTLLSSGAELVASPANFLQTIRTTVDQVRAAAGNALGSLAAYEDLLGSEPALTGRPSATSVAADANAQATVDMVRVAAAAGAARAAAEVDWGSNAEAVRRRDALTAALDVLLEEPQTLDVVYSELLVMRARIVDAIPTTAQSLERVRLVSLPRATPAVVLAYRLFDDVGRVEEVLGRNPGRISHPGFIPGQTPLEVLSG